ncbi:PSP1 domain-containing protein [Frigoriglobus tundricola]|uniref:Stage 0 sporulation protein YaaT n=1 Tax=Frigoriglobus tundricola TaxID=2774151 RepID=A0A6M5Z5F2_9BACT|nr:regulatory iron-sulfur-containing complex subunit RicT [Frigoriglobus tundricola]QJX01047.1 Stage 0 sporulation protein YaaT [Frigoriglobus tundricola]
MTATNYTPLPAVTFLVRHGSMRFLGVFTQPPGTTVRRGDVVVLRTERGQESGEVLCPATPEAVAAIPEPTRGEIVRVAGPEDREKMARVREQQQLQYETGAKLVAQHKLAMQIVDVEYLFGGERLIFYFLAEGRVDFRDLVKSMAREFHTRIELRQIGVRDEAKLLADYGDCGKPVCCNTHMVVMPPVSMRMAKLQKSTLDPTKISGRCGRLKCCLRFEQDVYEEFQQELPAVNSRVVTAKGQGRVLAQEILARRVLIEFEDGRRLPVSVDEVLTRL